MKTVSYSDFLNEVDKFWSDNNSSPDVLVVAHPFTGEDKSLKDVELWYIIPGNCHNFISLDSIYDLYLTDDTFKKHIVDGSITEETLKSNLSELYTSSDRIIIRFLGDDSIQVNMNYRTKADDKQFIYKTLVEDWFKCRKFTIAPFEIPDASYIEIWKGKRKDDKIEDTSTKIEYISFDEFKKRVKDIHGVELN